VASNEAVFNLGRADADALHVLDLAAAVNTTAARLAHFVVMAQAGDQFALEFASGGR
jgi:fatty acid/phospholipid biosynthesis enzyme